MKRAGRIKSGYISAISHPLVGDETYGGDKTGEKRQIGAQCEICRLRRNARCCTRSGSIHPSGHRRRCSANAPLPEDFSGLIESWIPYREEGYPVQPRSRQTWSGGARDILCRRRRSFPQQAQPIRISQAAPHIGGYRLPQDRDTVGGH